MLARARQSTFARLAPLCLAMFCGFQTVSIPLPVLPLYVHDSLGFGLTLAGFSVGLQSFATLLTRATAGRSVDRIGSKATLVNGLAIASAAGLAMVLSAVLPLPDWGRLGVILAARVINGMGESLLITGVLTWAVSRAGPGRSGQAMSWNGMAQYGALAVGAPFGLALYKAFGFAGMALATVILPVIAIAVVWRIAGVPASGGRRLPLTSVIGLIWHPGVGLMLAGIGFAALSTFASLTFAARGWSGAGLALTAFGGAFILVRLFAGTLPDRFGGRRIAMLSLTTEAAGQLVLWLAPVPAIAVLGAAMTGAGCALVFPAFGVEVVNRVPTESRGIALGAFAAFQDLAIGITGPVLGSAAAHLGPQSVFFGGLVAALTGVAVSAGLATRVMDPASSRPL